MRARNAHSQVVNSKTLPGFSFKLVTGLGRNLTGFFVDSNTGRAVGVPSEGGNWTPAPEMRQPTTVGLYISAIGYAGTLLGNVTMSYQYRDVDLIYSANSTGPNGQGCQNDGVPYDRDSNSHRVGNATFNTSAESDGRYFCDCGRFASGENSETVNAVVGVVSRGRR